MTASPLILGIDVGTSGLKAVLLDALGQTVDEAASDYPIDAPQPGWTERDSNDWWTATCRTLHALWSRGHSSQAVEAVGLAGQMHSLVLIDEKGDALAPAIVWSDQRTYAECAEITQRIGAARLLQPQIRPCQASPPPSCSGLNATGQRRTAALARCCCRRISSVFE